MKNIIVSLQKIENYIIVVSFGFMVFCSFAAVVNRNIFQFPIAWFDEAATYCMIYMTLLGTEIGLRDGSQIAVTALVNKFKGVSKQVLQILTTAALHLPMSVPYMALVISFGVITVVQLVITIKMVIDLVKGNIPTENGGVGV